MISKADVPVRGLVQGLNFSVDIILRTEPNVLSGSKYFYNTVNIKEEIEVNGTVNGIDIEKKCNSIIGTTFINGIQRINKDRF